MDLQFEPAEREQIKARAAIIGPGGSGRTRAALTLARSFGGTVGVIDTERRRASTHADQFTFRRLNLTHYDPRALCEACAVAAHSGIDVLLIDGLSAFWSGAGGVLECVDDARRGGRGNNNGWSQVRPYERSVFSALNAYPGHVIITLRAKIEWVPEEDITTHRLSVRRITTRPDQREGIEYDFDHVAELDDDHSVRFVKSLCPQLDRAVFPQFTEEIGETLVAWLSEGTPTKNALDYCREAKETSLTRADLQRLRAEVSHAGLDGAAVMGPKGPTTLALYLRAREEEAAG